MATENKSNSNIVKTRPPMSQGHSQGHSGLSSSSKGKMSLELNNKRKIETGTTTSTTTSSSKQFHDSKHKSLTPVTRIEGRMKTESTSSKTVTKTTVKVKSQKKVYSLPGQKYDPPEEREPLRIFYESLSEQIPSSEMAAFWMMEHGLLSPERAKKAYERKQKRQQQQRTGTPSKPLPKLNAHESSQKLQAASKNSDMKGKRKLMDGSDDEDDFIVKHKKGKG